MKTEFVRNIKNISLFSMTQNRKRGRNIQDEEIEFMPLSKRINNLHINGSLLTNDANVNLARNTEWGPGPPCFNSAVQHNLPETPPETVQHIDFYRVPRYNPELNEVENPHYFNVNKLLFEMYVERTQRNGQSFEI